MPLRDDRFTLPIHGASRTAEVCSDKCLQIILLKFKSYGPTKEQMETGLAEIEQYAAVWNASPALLVIKPHLGLIVSLEDIKHDRRYFALAIAVEEAIVAPEGFDAQVPITLKCVWNQPYMSLSVDSISAPYCFLPSFRSSRRATDSRIQRHEVV